MTMTNHDVDAISRNLVALLGGERIVDTAVRIHGKKLIIARSALSAAES